MKFIVTHNNRHEEGIQTPTQKLKIGFSIFRSLEIGSSLVSLEMIFAALQSELLDSTISFMSKFHPKFPEFTLNFLKLVKFLQFLGI